MPKPWKRRLIRGLGVVAALLAAFVLVVLVDGWRAFGQRAQGERRGRVESSPQWGDGVFENPQPLWNDAWGTIKGIFTASSEGSPLHPLTFESVDRSRFATPPASGMRVTWLGHSTLLLEIDGHRILTDPVWGERSSPLSWLGPARWYPPPLPLDQLPKLDAVVISHDHYDHLDYPTITALAGLDTMFIAPLGVTAHLEYWGVPAERIVEVDWWDRTQVGDLEIVCVPARHASGRMLFGMNTTLWAGYAVLGPQHRAYFSGDTGLFPALAEIGERLGPFDLTMIEAGAYHSAWPDWHLGPEQAVVAHQMVRGRVMLPIHWGLFNLAFHGWTEPIERVLVAAESSGVVVLAPRPGQSVEPEAPGPMEAWWPEVSWRTGAQDPIVATLME